MGVKLIALSPDQPERLQKSVAKQNLTFTLYSDPELAACRQFGIAFGAAGKRTLPVPAVFLFDADGVITFQYVNPTYSFRLDPQVLLAVAKSLAGS